MKKITRLIKFNLVVKCGKETWHRLTEHTVHARRVVHVRNNKHQKGPIRSGHVLVKVFKSPFQHLSDI